MGTLLLDPDNLVITDQAAGAGGPLDAGVGDGIIDFLDGNPNDTVSAGALEALPAATNISLRATNSITIDPLTAAKGGVPGELTLDQDGVVEFRTGSGGFSMGVHS